MDDSKKAIQNIKQALRQLATNGVPVGNMIEAMKEIEEKYAESEDEKIRKWLVEEIYKSVNSSINKGFDIDMGGKALAWLEKQGEPKPALAKVGEDGSMDKSWHPEKQGEQKPVEVKPFNKVFSQEEINLIDKRIEEMQRIHDAELRDKQKNAKDFPMTD